MGVLRVGILRAGAPLGFCRCACSFFALRRRVQSFLKGSHPRHVSLPSSLRVEAKRRRLPYRNSPSSSSFCEVDESLLCCAWTLRREVWVGGSKTRWLRPVSQGSVRGIQFTTLPWSIPVPNCRCTKARLHSTQDLNGYTRNNLIQFQARTPYEGGCHACLSAIAIPFYRDTMSTRVGCIIFESVPYYYCCAHRIDK